MDNPEKLATYDTENKAKTKHIMYWTPSYTNKHK